MEGFARDYSQHDRQREFGNGDARRILRPGESGGAEQGQLDNRRRDPSANPEILVQDPRA
jgi:hypothetical protein